MCLEGILAGGSCRDGSGGGGGRSGCSDFIGKVFPGLKESWAESEAALREGADRWIRDWWGKGDGLAVW